MRRTAHLPAATAFLHAGYIVQYVRMLTELQRAAVLDSALGYGAWDAVRVNATLDAAAQGCFTSDPSACRPSLAVCNATSLAGEPHHSAAAVVEWRVVVRALSGGMHTTDFDVITASCTHNTYTDARHNTSRAKQRAARLLHGRDTCARGGACSGLLRCAIRRRVV